MDKPLTAGLLVVTGLPGTGKTTLARALCASFKVTYVGLDDIVLPALSMSQLSETQAAGLGYEVARTIAAANCCLGSAVVIDGVHPRHGQRQAWVDLAGELGIRLIFLQTSLGAAEHQRRVAARQQRGSGRMGPTWEDIQGYRYEAWAEPHRIHVHMIDTADIDAAIGHARALLKMLTRPVS